MTEVLIVGGGPVGLCCAIDLLQRGIPCKVIEKASAFAVGTRARGISPRTQELLDSLGILHELRRFTEPSLPTRFYDRSGCLVREAQPAALLQPSGDVPFPNALMVSQQNTDRVLRARLAELGGELKVNCALTGLRQDDATVAATVLSSAGTETIRARYVIGSDGGGSKVRECAGLQLAGESWDDASSYLIGNLSVSGVDREHWHIWTDPEWGYLTLQPVFHHSDTGDGASWLFVASIPAGTSPDWAATAEAMQHLFNQRLPSVAVSFRNLTWRSLYRRRLRIADRFRDASIFLAGDSAHIGVEQGMNIGIQDGLNLTWKLACRLRGAPERLLDTYQEERRPIANQILMATLERDRVAQGASAAAQSITNAVTNQTGASDPTQLRTEYRSSSLSRDFAAGTAIRAGDRAPDGMIASHAGDRLRLFQLIDCRRFNLLHFTGDVRAAPLPPEALMGREYLAVHRISASGGLAKGNAVALIDLDGQVCRAYGVESQALVLIRPDGYVGATGTVDQLARILEYANSNYAL
jgi:2-polyprenyl-6-methoxyphenol hydroxylase-like FAD-dependent oxidoreductase